MAIRNVAVSSAGVASESLNDQAALITAAADANAVAGSNADVTAELAAISANQPSGDVVVTVDLSAVTTKNQLRRALDAAYVHLASSTNLLT